MCYSCFTCRTGQFSSVLTNNVTSTWRPLRCDHLNLCVWTSVSECVTGIRQMSLFASCRPREPPSHSCMSSPNNHVSVGNSQTVCVCACVCGRGVEIILCVCVWEQLVRALCFLVMNGASTSVQMFQMFQRCMSVAIISAGCSVPISPEEDQDLYQTTNDRCFAPGPGETRNVLSAAALARTQKVQRQSQSNAADREDKIKKDRHHRSWHRHVTCPDLERQEFYTQFIQCYLVIDWLDNYMNTWQWWGEKTPFWREETFNSILMIVICNTEDNNTISIGNAVIILCIISYYVLLCTFSC